MAKKPSRKPVGEPAGEPTARRPVDGNGYELDEWDLPFVGPARIARLEALGRRDPNEFPDDWPEGQGAAEVPVVVLDEAGADAEVASQLAGDTEEVNNG